MTQSPPAEDLSYLPAFVTPDTLITFVGGTKTLIANASHLKTGNERWRTFILDDVVKRGSDTVRKWLIMQMDSFVAFFSMMHGPRPTNNNADEWDATFEDSLFAFFSPHFEFVFPDPAKREEQILAWLGRNIEQAATFMADAGNRAMLAELLAKSIVAGVLDTREKPGHKLSMLGVVAPKPTKAEEQGPPQPLPPPPQPAQEFPEEWGKSAAPLGAATIAAPIECPPPRGARKRVRASQTGTVKLEPAFMKQFTEQAGFTQADFAALLGVAKSTVSNASTKEGLLIDNEDGQGLIDALNHRITQITALVAHLHNALIWAEQVREHAPSRKKPRQTP